MFYLNKSVAIVRHGKTGGEPWDLDEIGISQIEATAAWLKDKISKGALIYTSSELRARSSGAILSRVLGVSISDGLAPYFLQNRSHTYDDTSGSLMELVNSASCQTVIIVTHDRQIENMLVPLRNEGLEMWAAIPKETRPEEPDYVGRLMNEGDCVLISSDGTCERISHKSAYI